MRNKEKQKYYSIPFIIIGLLLVLVILYVDKEKTNKIDIVSKGLETRQISGIISSASQNRGTTTLNLENGVILYFSTTRNYDLTPPNLYEFVKPGDSLYKEKGTMRIKIFRGNNVYDFELEKFINRK